MYIWAAIDIDDQLQEQKEAVKRIEKEIGFAQSDISLLPLHISLKISSEVKKEDENNLTEDIKALLRTVRPFAIEVDKTELNGNIIWIRMKENPKLKYLHDALCDIYAGYGIALHAYDMDFRYHSTLFLDGDEDKIREAFGKIKNMALPEKIIADQFIVGSSPDGKVGSYSVDFRIRYSK